MAEEEEFDPPSDKVCQEVREISASVVRMVASKWRDPRLAVTSLAISLAALLKVAYAQQDHEFLINQIPQLVRNAMEEMSGAGGRLQ
jgi:hypothetical protein